jgi:hypothetical protein
MIQKIHWLRKILYRRNMKVVCDTNIWYSKLNKEFGTKEKLLGTFISIHELATSRNLIRPDKIERIRRAIQQLMSVPFGYCLNDPIRYMATDGAPGTFDDIILNQRGLLEGLQLFANGHSVAESRYEEFLESIAEQNRPLHDFATLTNNYIHGIRQHMKEGRSQEEYELEMREYSKRSLRNPIPFRQLICTWISDVTGNNVQHTDIDWRKRFKFFDLVGRTFFLDLETGRRAWRVNDFHDFFNLVYVGHSDFYWTDEKDWRNWIRKANCGHYLYK